MPPAIRDRVRRLCHCDADDDGDDGALDEPGNGGEVNAQPPGDEEDDHADIGDAGEGADDGEVGQERAMEKQRP